jgi:hypothetical protein
MEPPTRNRRLYPATTANNEVDCNHSRIDGSGRDLEESENKPKNLLREPLAAPIRTDYSIEAWWKSQQNK